MPVTVSDGATKALYRRMADEIRSLPRVVDAGIGSSMPLSRSQFALDVKVEGKPVSSGQAVLRAQGRMADPSYFHAAGIPLLEGREFTSADRGRSAKVVILNMALADQLFPGESPLNCHIAWTGDVLQYAPFSVDWRTIVGVVGNTHDDGLEAAAPAAMYMPFDQEVPSGAAWSCGPTATCQRWRGAATRIVRQLAPGIPIENVRTVA